MTRGVRNGVLVGAMLLAPGGAYAAAPTLAISRAGAQATMTLRAEGLTVVQTLTPTRLRLELAAEGDHLLITGDLDGRVTVMRAGTRRVVSMRAGQPDGRRVFNTVVANSRALAAFERLLASPWAQTSRDARLFMSTGAWLRVVQGDHLIVSGMGAAAFAEAPSRPAPAGTVRLVGQRTPAQCWDTYAQDVTKFTYDLQACLSQASANWWNPLHTAWCAYEYNLKSSLSAFWLLDCYGVPT